MVSSPAPPHSSGMTIPRSPRSAIFSTTADGNRPSRSFSSTMGRSSASTKSRTIVRIMDSFSLGANSIRCLGLRLDEPEVAVRPPVEDAHALAARVAEHEERVLRSLRLQERLVDRHRLHGVAARADDARRAVRGRGEGRPERHLVLHLSASADGLRLAALLFPAVAGLEPARLLLELREDLADRLVEILGRLRAGQGGVRGVNDDLRRVAVLLDGQDDMGLDDSVEDPGQLFELLLRE